MRRQASRRWVLLVGLLGLSTVGNVWGQSKKTSAEKTKPIRVVFVTGDEEYRSEESMPMLAKILQRDYGMQVRVCYSLADDGTVDPNNRKSISGLEALDNADVMVLFTRFRALPKEQLEHIVKFAESGKPMVGFRTATHAFKYGKGPHQKMDNQWPINVFGQKWITHHGHFDDGKKTLTDVTLYEDAKDHPILRGIKPFEAYSWLYHVDGGDHTLTGDCQKLLQGRALKSNHQKAVRLKKYPLTNPVAWTKTYKGEHAKQPARVFFTTLGHPYDFKNEMARRLAIQGILWALGQEDRISKNGVSVEFVGPYTPSNSGAGQKFKKGIRPELLPTDTK